MRPFKRLSRCSVVGMSDEKCRERLETAIRNVESEREAL
jgi:hypothetical protein